MMSWHCRPTCVLHYITYDKSIVTQQSDVHCSCFLSICNFHWWFPLTTGHLPYKATLEGLALYLGGLQYTAVCSIKRLVGPSVYEWVAGRYNRHMYIGGMGPEKHQHVFLHIYLYINLWYRMYICSTLKAVWRYVTGSRLHRNAYIIQNILACKQWMIIINLPYICVNTRNRLYYNNAQHWEARDSYEKWYINSI